jgi:nucleotide sugar dehydrogenase
MNFTVIGMGKIGLPLAVQIAEKGFSVKGLDIDAITVATINSGKEPFPNERDLLEKLVAALIDKKFEATLDAKGAISEADVVIVVVPLFVDIEGSPDFTALDSVTRQIGLHMKKGALISYETTLPIGTTRSRFLSSLEDISGLEVGTDFNLVFSPERVSSGRIFSDLRKYPKVVGGITDQCTKSGVEIYSAILDFDYREDLPKPNGVWAMSSTEESEFVKVAETTYRDVNIGLANQFSRYASKMNLDIYSVIEAANSQHFSHIHNPGIAVGGHCIPVYPQFYMWNDSEATIVKAARELNSRMPGYALDIIEKNLDKLENRKILILGISYRSGVKEIAFSGSLALEKILQDKNISASFYDPLYSNDEIINMGLTPFDGDGDSIDIVIIQTEDSTHLELINQDLTNCEIIFDGRNIINASNYVGHARILGFGKHIFPKDR